MAFRRPVPEGHRPYLEAIAAAPGESILECVYADWLDENGFDDARIPAVCEIRIDFDVKAFSRMMEEFDSRLRNAVGERARKRMTMKTIHFQPLIRRLHKDTGTLSR